MSPPSQSFAVPTRVVALVRSTDPAQVLHAESSWSRWVTKAGGTFRAVSAYDSPAVSPVLSRAKRRNQECPHPMKVPR